MGKTICTTDYIMDPLVLKRLKELKNHEETSIDGLLQEVKSIDYSCNVLSFSGQEYIKCVDVINSVGTIVWKQSMGAAINVQTWPRGIYVVKVLYEDNSVLIKK